MLTHERLKELLSYDPETGRFTWKVNKGSTARIGVQPMSMNAGGYRRVYIDGRSYRQHRLAWLYMTGQWPTHEIDHINLDRADNRFANLREATPTQNMHNLATPASNTSGRKGAFWHKGARKWMSQIKIDGKLVYLGLHKTVDDAAEAYANAALKHYGEFARVD